MRHLSVRILLPILLLSLSGCAGTLEVGFEPAAQPDLEATVVALAGENARLADELAALKGMAAPVMLNTPTAAAIDGADDRTTATPTPAMAITGTAAVTPTVAAKRTVTPPPAAAPAADGPVCDVVPIRGFGIVWDENPEVAERLGCAADYPQPGELATDAAVQTFEHGVMLWLAADSGLAQDPVYVLFDGGVYQRFPDTGPADQSVVGEIEPGFDAPGERFSKAYWEGIEAADRERLGRATSEQTDSEGAYQQFAQGRMFWSGTLDRVFVLYDYLQPGDGEADPEPVRTWVSFEDTFVEPETTPETT